ncbi:DUF2087 domain-containing protein [Rummeliibacillus sp. POC4]|nr:DUF2087 domain-containing protein [Rummeliibacillus sp. POC4]
MNQFIMGQRKWMKVAISVEKKKKVLQTYFKNGLDVDYVSLRRYLIEYGFMERTDDCSIYWVKE